MKLYPITNILSIAVIVAIFVVLYYMPAMPQYCASCLASRDADSF